MFRILGASALCLVIGLTGCTSQRVGGTSSVKPTGFSQQGDVGNTLAVDKDGQTTQHYATEPPAAVIASERGVENYGAVPFGTVSASLPGGTSLVASVPNDFMAETVEITLTDGSVVKLGGVKVITSDTVVARASVILQNARNAAALGQAQRDVILEQFKQQAAAGDSLIQSLMPFIQALLAGG